MNIAFNHVLYKSNLLFIKDLFDAQGNPRTKLSLENSTGCNIMFTQYQALWRSMPRDWKEYMSELDISFNLEPPPVMSLIIKDTKGTSTIRKIWTLKQDSITPKGQMKWSLESQDPNRLEWIKIYNITKKCKLNARINYFQYQILHRSLVTNRKLHMFGIRDNENCDTCNTPETISHLIYECPLSNNIWNMVETWLTNTMNTRIYFDKEAILLGNPMNEIVTNCIILIVKHEIYKRKWNGNLLSLIRLKTIIKNHMDLDIYLGNVQGNLGKAVGKWSAVYNDLSNR